MEPEEPKPTVWENVESDEVLNRFAIALTAIPYVGGTLSALIQDGLIKKRFERVEEMVAGLHARVEELASEGKVSPDAATLGDDEAFQEMFLDTMLSVGSEASEEKRRLFQEFLAHMIAEGKHPGIREHQILTALELIDLSHLAVLRGLVEHRWQVGVPTRDQPFFQDAIRVFAGEDGGVWDDEIEGVLTDLRGWGLIYDAGDRTADNEIEWKPTQRGFQLVDYISHDWAGPLSMRHAED
jgi:hypothetical protein